MKKILLVEDDLYIRDLYYTAFTKAGFSVEKAVDGEDGVAKWQQGSYAIILLDIMMPKKNGIDVLRDIRHSNSVNRDVPIFLLTNLGQESVIKEAFSIGADGYILKSQLTPPEIIHEITQYLSQFESSSQAT